MLKKLFPDPQVHKRLFSGPLASCFDGFAALLADEGYTKATSKDKLRLIAHLSRWLQQQNLPVMALDEQCVEQFLADHHRHWISNGAEPTCKRLLSYLRELGHIPPPVETIDDTPLRRIECGYTHYLATERGLAAATVANYIPTVHRFLAEHCGTEEVGLGALCAQDVHRFILHHAPEVSRGGPS